MGYFVVFIIKLIFCFSPIVFGYAKYVHLQMVLLDSFTDLPLVFMIVITKGYDVNVAVFFDIVFKILLLLCSYSYHLIINILLKRFEEENDAQNEGDDNENNKKDENNEDEVVKMMTQHIQPMPPQQNVYAQPQLYQVQAGEYAKQPSMNVTVSYR